jgi:hypothetical protein
MVASSMRVYNPTCNDPIVVAHAKALLSGDNGDAVQGDVRVPASILTDPAVVGLRAPREPVALILCMVLHFFDADAVSEIMAAFVNSLHRVATSCSAWAAAMMRRASN